MHAVLTILGCGTSTGVPIPGCPCKVCTSTNPRNRRDRTSALISVENGPNILIDATPDLRQQALAYNIHSLDAVLFTHAHADHILGVDDLRVFNFISRKALPCYCEKGTLDGIQRCFRYLFERDPNYEGGMLAELDFQLITPLNPFEAGIEFFPFRLHHGSMDVTGYRFGNAAYATDCNAIPAESLAHLHGLDLLILDGLRYKPHPTHFTIPRAIEVAEELGAKRTVLIHMTHSVDYEATSVTLPSNVELAYDGMKIPIEV